MIDYAKDIVEGLVSFRHNTPNSNPKPTVEGTQHPTHGARSQCITARREGTRRHIPATCHQVRPYPPRRPPEGHVRRINQPRTTNHGGARNRVMDWEAMGRKELWRDSATQRGTQWGSGSLTREVFDIESWTGSRGGGRDCGGTQHHTSISRGTHLKDQSGRSRIHSSPLAWRDSHTCACVY